MNPRVAQRRNRSIQASEHHLDLARSALSGIPPPNRFMQPYDCDTHSANSTSRQCSEVENWLDIQIKSIGKAASVGSYHPMDLKR